MPPFRPPASLLRNFTGCHLRAKRPGLRQPSAAFRRPLPKPPKTRPSSGHVSSFLLLFKDRISSKVIKGYSRKNFSHEPNFPGNGRIRVNPTKSNLSNKMRRGGFGGGSAESTAMKKPQNPKGRPVIPQSREDPQEWGHKNGENRRATASRSFPGTVRPSTSARVTSCARRSFCWMMFFIVRAKSLP